MLKKFKVGNHLVGEGCNPFFIAEAGVNHNGSIDIAKRLIDVATKAKADAVKFQTFNPDKLIIKSAPKARYQQRTTGKGTFYAMLKKLQLDSSAHEELFKYAKKKGIMFISTPFDEDSADMLCNLGVNAIKIDSGNLNNIFLVEHVAKKKKPIILSTGMSTLGEIEESLDIIKKYNDKVILLHCTSNYPPRFEDVHLNAIKTLRTAFDIPVGYSDHTPGIVTSIAAVSLGAVVVEKHFTLDRSSSGPDHLASVEPEELELLIKSIRMVPTILGSSIKAPVEAEKNETIPSLRRSVVSNQFIKGGTVITKDMISIKRPGNGIPPKYFNIFVGKTAKKDIKPDSLIKW